MKRAELRLVAVLDARMRLSVDVVTRAISLGRKLAGCDLVITGSCQIER